ncbi:MAG: 16S rRNA (guanine(527)-N(7))-methyltransferase RsmG [Solirubrobacteraceae bacterium]
MKPFDDPSGATALAVRYGLSVIAGEKLVALADCVAGDPQAPTTVTDRSGILRDHLADSLVALELDEVRGATAIADLGAGAGFPGLPLAIGLPSAQVSLVESNGRKCAFIARAIDACALHNAAAVHARAESWPRGLGACDLVTARALAPLAVVAEYAAPLLTEGGWLIAWRGRRDPDDETAAARAGAELGLEPGPVTRVEPYPGALHRHLHLMRKVAPTPDGFPRRPGMARKRPLGRSV